jgi:phosphatidylserine decarboxylase
MDKIVVGNFVTASQAQRKWYTKIISKVSGGDYRLGAVNFISLFDVLMQF